MLDTMTTTTTTSTDTTSTEKSMVTFVVKEFERYEAYHRDRFEDAEKEYDHWIGKAPRREYPHLNAVHVPITFEAEQTISPRIFTALFPNDAPVDVKAEGDAPPTQAIKIKGGIQHYFRVANVTGEARPALTQCTLFGTGYVEGGSWLVKRAWQTSEAGDRYYAIVESRPDCKFVNFFEIYPHPAKSRLDDGLPIVRRRFIDAEALKSLKENPFFKFTNLDDALQSEPTAKPSHPAYQAKKGEDYEILEYWGPYDENYEKDGKLMVYKAVPHWIIVINRQILIRGIPNPYNHQLPPYCKFILYPDAKPGWFGVGVGKIGRPTQERVNKLVNQRLDNVDLVLNKMGFYNANDTLLNTNKLKVSKPGLWLGVSDVNQSVRWMETPDVTQSSYQEEGIAKQDFRESTGATMQLLPGDSAAQHRTALGIQILQGAAGMRFRPALQQIEIDFIQQLAMFFFSNMQQFMTKDEWVLISGETGEEEAVLIKPEDLQAKVFFIPTGISETINKEVQIENLLKFKQLTQEDPTINRVEINKRIAETMGFRDVQKLFVQQQPNQPQSSLTPEEQQQITQRLAEGASPDQIKQEMVGNPPMPEGEG